jgi:GNAT superfamily N-acetyltransferase
VSEPGGIGIERVDWLDPRAVTLRDAMDDEMTAIYGPGFQRYPPEVRTLFGAAFSVEPSSVIATLLAVRDGEPVGLAGLRPFGDAGALEVKKVFVDRAHRGRGISRRLMLELEPIALERDAPSLVLQTGDLQPAAIGLYESIGYHLIPPYPPFELMSNALCYEKVL